MMSSVVVGKLGVAGEDPVRRLLGDDAEVAVGEVEDGGQGGEGSIKAVGTDNAELVIALSALRCEEVAGPGVKVEEDGVVAHDEAVGAILGTGVVAGCADLGEDDLDVDAGAEPGRGGVGRRTPRVLVAAGTPGET